MVLSTRVEQVSVPNANGAIDGVLWLPDDPVGVILLADGRSGYRVKPPIDYVGTVLRNARLGTFWLDLSPRGEADHAGGDHEALVGQLEAACDWLNEHQAVRDVPVGLFGAGVGVAAVLQLAARLGSKVFAVVLRGGRPELASQGNLPRVNAPTLLIAGSLDERMVGVNRAIYAALRCKKRLEIIPGATHSFEEPGSLEVVARLTRAWYLQNVRVKHV
jgi:putative phosphoribosyl transferase